ncbi:helix-turn-helix domain-containing protein [Polynucleobacter sp. MWH-UH2A]|uniref:helix-turn-helix domain-containing protein n=1 Tax=Polynucleobacter sp. MWH-UH2A TaxID=1855617 RepID=UPI001BFD8AE3|nr:helix-turn-helix domain-containing protein [Polynucleobacter sp. MWH-UH2A]QWD64592.1 helix-turn-helix transcriptional regulator [Polynucleobacter sp. MWH-UH2A]
MKQTRLPEIIGSALKAAREKRGLERGELATQCCLSSKMILELEEGGMTSFYNFQLKLSSAKRVGAFLGLSLSDYLDQPVELIEPLTISAEADSLTDAEEVDLSQENINDKEDVKSADVSPPKPVVDEGEQLDDLIYESTHSGTSMPYVAAPSTPFKKFGLALSLAIVIGGLYGVESKFQISNSALALVENFGAKKIEPQDPPSEIALQEPRQIAFEEAVTEKTQAKPESVIAVAPAQSQCPPARDEVSIYKSPNPSKLGDSVNIKTLVKQSICVADGQGRQSLVDLEPNTAHSFRGVSPFIISAQDLDNVEMYFQGWRVRPPNSGMKQMKLVEVATQ